MAAAVETPMARVAVARQGRWRLGQQAWVRRRPAARGHGVCARSVALCLHRATSCPSVARYGGGTTAASSRRRRRPAPVFFASCGCRCSCVSLQVMTKRRCFHCALWARWPPRCGRTGRRGPQHRQECWAPRTTTPHPTTSHGFGQSSLLSSLLGPTPPHPRCPSR